LRRTKYCTAPLASYSARPESGGRFGPKAPAPAATQGFAATDFRLDAPADATSARNGRITANVATADALEVLELVRAGQRAERDDAEAVGVTARRLERRAQRRDRLRQPGAADRDPPVGVLGDVGLIQKQLALFDRGIGIDQLHFAKTA
jgi:hypothetical protein